MWDLDLREEATASNRLSLMEENLPGLSFHAELQAATCRSSKVGFVQGPPEKETSPFAQQYPELLGQSAHLASASNFRAQGTQRALLAPAPAPALPARQ